MNTDIHNVAKSAVVIIILGILLYFFIQQKNKIVIIVREKQWMRSELVMAIAKLLAIVLLFFSLLDYSYPFDRSIPFEHVETITLAENHSLDYPGVLFWHTAYKFEYLCGILHAESRFFKPDEKESYLGFYWPDMDFDRYTYVITYGQELEQLSYNVWETIDVPIHTDIKVGHAKLSDQFVSDKIYIYQISRMRIDNDP